ncbi:MAG: NADH-quinone oxidoreductase subunit K [Candidatus Cloacimonetes bacterium 4572_55]|nr:MAG: NADH-quinone oxidoreductase subunit K [Candidatus Cloacimonetes bacterium 4572_55]
MFFTLENCLILSVILFSIGCYGVLTKRNILVILMSIELMLNAVNLSFISFNYFNYNMMNGEEMGHFFVLVIIAIAAAEAAVGLAILVALFRNRDSADIEKLVEMKW